MRNPSAFHSPQSLAAAQHHPLQRLQVAHSRGLARRRRAPVAVRQQSPATRAASAQIAASSGVASGRAARRVRWPRLPDGQYSVPRSKVAGCIAHARWPASTSPRACRRAPCPPPPRWPSDARRGTPPAQLRSARRSGTVRRRGFLAVSCAAKSNKTLLQSTTSSRFSCAGA